MMLDVLEIKTINCDKSYHGWPTVTRRKSGELLVVASAGRREHVDPFGQLHLIRSNDDGATWSLPQILADTALDDRDAGIIETSRGTLVVCWFTSLAWLNYLYRQEIGVINWLSAESLTSWRQYRRERIEKIDARQELGSWILRSEDGGQTWAPRVPALVSSPHGPIELSDGRLLHVGKQTGPYENWVRGSSHEGMPIAAAESCDDGKSWQIIGTVPFADGHDVSSYHEPHCVETLDGRLVAQIRNHNAPHAGETLQCESSDGGRTWSVPKSIGVWGLPSHLLRLQSGRLLMTYGYRRAPFGNQARYSDDQGRTWSAPLTISADGNGVDLGYPSAVELADGTILTVWYELMKDNRNAVLRQAKWCLK